MQYAHALAVAVLVGKVVLLSFVVAPILAKQLGPDQFGPVNFADYSLPTWGHGRGDGRTPVAARGWIRPRAEARRCWEPEGSGGDSSRRVLLSFAADSTKAMRCGISSKEQEQQGDVDPVLQAAWTRLHQRSLCLNSLVLIGGLCLVGMIRQFSS